MLFEHFECQRGLYPSCLDWSEICDGIIDCYNGIDEESCWQLDMNTCQMNEYRCLNGQCISKRFHRDDSNVLINQMKVIQNTSFLIALQINQHLPMKMSHVLDDKDHIISN